MSAVVEDTRNEDRQTTACVSREDRDESLRRRRSDIERPADFVGRTKSSSAFRAPNDSWAWARGRARWRRKCLPFEMASGLSKRNGRRGAKRGGRGKKTQRMNGEGGSG